jgi:type II secretory pathway component PulF
MASLSHGALAELSDKVSVGRGRRGDRARVGRGERASCILAAPGGAGRWARERTMATEESSLGAVEIVLGALIAVTAVALVAMEVVVVPGFVEMFRDFGAVLPMVTRIALAPGVPVAAAVAVLALGGAGIAARLRGAAGAALGLLVSALLLGLGANAFLLYALYAPIFALAGSIKP